MNENTTLLPDQPAHRWVIALAWTALAVVLLVQPSGQPVIGPAAPPGPPSLRRELLLTTGHVVMFATLTVVWWWALRRSVRWALSGAVLIALALGFATELAQTLVPDRNASLYDLAVNTLVTLATALAIRAWQQRTDR